jgi:CRISPR/Cas system-associated exonuclease Cas4 (RecB family)
MSERANRILAHALAGTPCDLGNSQWYIPKKAYRDAFGGGLLAMLAEKEARAMIASWIAAENTHLKPGLTRRPVLLEHPFSCMVDGMQIVGRIDRVDVVKTDAGLVYEIIDYKTTATTVLSGNQILKEFAPNFSLDGSDADQEDAKKLATNYQTLLYLHANRTDAPSKFPPPMRMYYAYIGKKSTTGEVNPDIYRSIEIHPSDVKTKTASKGKHLVLSVTAELLKTTAETTMRDTMIDMRHTPYPIKPGRACAFCPFITICDATLDDQQGEGEDR